MKKKVVLGLVAALTVLLVAGGLYASNMGFKLNYVLDGQGTNGSASGINTIALPFNQQTDLIDAFDLITDIGGTTVVAGVAQFDRTSNGFAGYAGTSGEPFALVAGDAYLVQLQASTPSVNYIVVGSHDPGLVINFDGAGTNGSANGTNFYAYPYHSTSTAADELIAELGTTTTIAGVSRFDRTSNGFASYAGTSGEAFALEPGKGYLVQLQGGVPSVSFVPSHF
jgi:hypothetical protein